MYRLIKKIAKAKTEYLAFDNTRMYSQNFGDFVFCKSMNFRSNYLETLAEEKNRELNSKARKQAAEYHLETCVISSIQYSAIQLRKAFQ